MSNNNRPASSSQRDTNTNNSGTKANVTLDKARVHSQKSTPSAHNDHMSDNITSPAQREQNTDPASTDVNARLDRVLAHYFRGATPLHAPPSASMAYAREEALANDQSTCPLFRLAPELRNTICTYVVYSKFDLAFFQWDEEHNSPKLSLKQAQARAPSNDLLRTCRRIHNESKGIFVEAKTRYWSDTTFTLALAGGAKWAPSNSFRYFECLLDDQVNHMTRVNIEILGSRLFTVHLRSGSDADDSVTVTDSCDHRVPVAAPLSFVESVESANQVQGQLRFEDVRGILHDWRSRPDSTYLRLCVEHHPEPVILSVRDLSRAGFMAVVAWTCWG